VTAQASSLFVYEEHPDHPGWMRWHLREPGRYNDFVGELLVRREGDVARVRMTPHARHANLGDHVHGGALLGFMDTAMFAALRAFAPDRPGMAVTLDLQTHFVAPGRLDEPIEARIELLRDTGRLAFLRGLLVQEVVVVAEFSGTIRKADAR